MPLYHVVFEVDADAYEEFVEARSLADALMLFAASVAPDLLDPISITRLTDGDVLRDGGGIVTGHC